MFAASVAGVAWSLLENRTVGWQDTEKRNRSLGNAKRSLCMEGDKNTGGSARGDISMAEYTCWLENEKANA